MPNDHVLILDTSAWMAAQTDRGRLIDQARAAAKAYLKSLPAQRPRDAGARRRVGHAR